MPHRSFRTRWAGPIVLLTAVGAGLSCRDALSPVPQPAIRSDAAPAPYAATFPLGSPDDPKDTMELNEFTERRVVRITLSGTLTATHEEDPANNPDRVLGPGGYADCTARVYVIYAGDQGTWLPYCGTGGDGSPLTSAPVQVQGHGRVFREGYGEGGNWRCASPRQEEFCWRFSGSQQVSIEVVEFDGRLDTWYANGFRTTIPAPDYVYFNWTVVNAAGNPPVETYDWKFVPTDGSSPDPAPIPYGANNRSYWVPESGTMYVNVKINGATKTLSQYIHVGPATLSLSATPAETYVGDTVHFSADIRPDSTSVSGLRWFWLPDAQVASALRASLTGGSKPSKASTHTSTSASLQAPDSSSEVESCASQRTCDHVVHANGTMFVQANLAGTATSADKYISVRAGIRVECVSVTRGEVTTCAASGEPAGTIFQVTGWTFYFTDDHGADSVVRTEQVTDTTWSGPAVIDGMLVVRATVAGATVQKSASLAVRSRASLDTVAYDIDTLATTGLPVPPDSFHDFGSTGFLPLESTSFPGLVQVDSGPNAGLFYFTGIPWPVDVDVDINRTSMAVDSEMWKMQSASRRSDGSNPPWCSRADLTALLPAVEAHEGLTRNAPNSHTKAYLDAFEREATKILEPYASTSPVMRPKLLAVQNASLEESRFVADTLHPISTNCKFNYDPAVTFP